MKFDFWWSPFKWILNLERLVLNQVCDSIDLFYRDVILLSYFYFFQLKISTTCRSIKFDFTDAKHSLIFSNQQVKEKKKIKTRNQINFVNVYMKFLCVWDV